MVVDQIIQQIMAQLLTTIYEPIFSEYSFGIHPKQSTYMAMEVMWTRARRIYSMTKHRGI